MLLQQVISTETSKGNICPQGKEVMGLLEYLMGEEEPFWMRRAKGQTNSPLVNEMYLEDKGGNPQTIYSATTPLGYLPSAEGAMYPTIRWRSPGLERLSALQAYMEAMKNKDYKTFPSLWDANIFAEKFSKGIKRKKRD